MDIYRTVTDKIIAALENAAKWEKPWTTSFAGIAHGRPRNAETGKPYQGINVPLLWSAGFESPEWATYKCWRRLDCQVRKGERSTLAIWWNKQEIPREDGNDNSDDGHEYRMICRAFSLFNAAQVDGYQPPAEPTSPAFDPIANAESFFANTSAAIRHGGDRAFYSPGLDFIQMPHRSAFVGTTTSTPAECYYSTLGHESVHWTGHESRCNRDFSGRFGSEAYAFEELIAELGSAFLCADLGITNEPRPDHAAYLKSWLRVLRDDRKAVFTAASQAEKAVRLLHDKQQQLAIAA